MRSRRRMRLAHGAMSVTGAHGDADAKAYRTNSGGVACAADAGQAMLRLLVGRMDAGAAPGGGTDDIPARACPTSASGASVHHEVRR